MALKMRKAEARDISALCELMTELSGRAFSREQMLDRLRMIKESKIDLLYIC
jgi:hypothetical protein